MVTAPPVVPEIAERQVDGAAVTDQGQQGAHRDSGQQNQFGHEEQQPEEDQKDDVEEFHSGSNRL